VFRSIADVCKHLKGSVVMSRGPGRVVRAIEGVFAAESDNAFTTAELCERVYRNEAIVKKHSPRVRRRASAKNLPRDPSWVCGAMMGEVPVNRTLFGCPAPQPARGRARRKPLCASRLALVSLVFSP
jgi:hypothetical protein